MLILQGLNYPVDAITFSPDSTALYVVQGHHGIRAWNIADRASVPVEYDAKLLIAQFAFDPTGRWAISATAQTSPADHIRGRLIDFATGTAHRFNAAGSERSNAAFCAGGRLVSIGSSWYDPDRTSPNEFQSRYYGWALAATGPAYEWHRDFPSNEQPLFIAALDDRFAAAELVAPGATAHMSQSWNLRLAIRRASDGFLVMELPNPPREVQQLLTAPDGSLVVSRFGPELHAWTADGSGPQRVAGGYNPFLQGAAAAFHPSGRYLLLARDDTTVTAFDTATLQPAHRWAWDAGPLQACAVSPDATLAAAGSDRGTVVLWDLDL